MSKKSRPRKLSVYSNLSKHRKDKKEVEKKRRAEYLATLPKHPIKRFFYRLHPKRFWGYWFSKRGLLMAVKLTGVFLLLMVLLVGALFAYFRKDLNQINPDELAKRVQTSVTKYYDRNGILLWEDKGSGNYKLVVKSDELSDNLKKATVAIEDQDFYAHGGVSISGTLRAVINNATGGEVQGGSTLTQQLVKQVFFTTEGESLDRGLGGIPRKIKEAILAIEVERTYSKDQILTLYLNESPYGGRRNGAESGAQSYFGKHAKDLTIAEAALLAAIPQNPTVYDPYNVAGHDGLIARQHTVLDKMQELGYATKEQIDEAKAYPILDHLQKRSDQYDDIKAPHFVEMVRAELEAELGDTTVGQGGLRVTTTLDYRIQKKLEEAMNDMFTSSTPITAGFTNGAGTVEDTKTGQIVAMVGSRSFNYPGFGQDNAATAYIQPGSTIKPLVYAELFQQKPEGSANYGSGSILVDENIDSIYRSRLDNADRKFNGPMTIRSALATSRNVPAVSAMYISGIQPTLDTIHELGGTSYCSEGVDTQVQLSSAIGGCGISQVDLVSAYSSISRGGVYKPQTSILEVKNNSGEVLKQWSDTAGEEVLDPQAAYIVSDILTDEVARRPLDGYYATGMWIDGVQTASKTGTSDKGGQAKDIWMVSYSPVLSMAVWLGNPDTSTLLQGTSLIPGPIIEKVMAYAHKEVYAKDGKWKTGDWFTAPDGIKRVGNEVYPSYWSKTQGQTNTKLTFDKVSKKKATECTPDAAKITFDVVKTKNPVTKKDSYSSVPGGYDATKSDDVHKCGDADPQASVDISPDGSENGYLINATATRGTFALGTITIAIGGTTVKTCSDADTCSYEVELDESDEEAQAVTVTVTDEGYYTDEATDELPAYSDSGPGPNPNPSP